MGEDVEERSVCRRMPSSQRGQGMVEYALIVVLVAIIVLAVLTTMGPQLAAAFRDVVGEISRNRA